MYLDDAPIAERLGLSRRKSLLRTLTHTVMKATRGAVVVKSRLITPLHNMDVASISALSALAGSVVGGLTSGFTTWLSQRAQARAGQLAHNKSEREAWP